MSKSILNAGDVIITVNERIKMNERKDGVYYYDVRHSDECGMTPASIGEFVMINHMFTVGMLKPLDLGADGELLLTEEDEGILMDAFFNNDKNGGEDIVYISYQCT